MIELALRRANFSRICAGFDAQVFIREHDLFRAFPHVVSPESYGLSDLARPFAELHGAPLFTLNPGNNHLKIVMIP